MRARFTHVMYSSDNGGLMFGGPELEILEISTRRSCRNCVIIDIQQKGDPRVCVAENGRLVRQSKEFTEQQLNMVRNLRMRSDFKQDLILNLDT